MKHPKIKNVIFDLGGVLVDWNPEYLYEKVFAETPEKMSFFLNNVCNHDWNIEQDAGRTFDEGAQILKQQFPEFEKEIGLFYDRWEEMLKGEIKGTELILRKLKSLNEVKLYALTNWSSETFPIAKKRFDFLNLFEGIVVSGEEHTRKPFPKIYQITLERFKLLASESVFIDDSLENVESARKMGIHSIHFKNPEQLKTALQQFQVLNK
ncbi:HAD family hydrolase [Lutimonas sp.]|uniref:HAD family hydrolase n=1 Tax=Lutimonas sp. TaxID=1872403 RepID=UPI003D9AE22C